MDRSDRDRKVKPDTKFERTIPQPIDRIRSFISSSSKVFKGTPLYAVFKYWEFLLFQDRIG